MALWNKISSGFDAEDETINFGTRIITESNGSIYETVTAATIEPDREVESNPKVSSCIWYSKLCVVIDKSITIFKEDSCLDIELCIAFDSVISSYCLSKEEVFLFVTLSNGILHCLHLPSGGVNKFQTYIQCLKPSETIIQIFPEESSDIFDITFVSSMGSIYSISKFDGKLFDSIFKTENEDSIMGFVNKIQWKTLLIGNLESKIVHAEQANAKQEEEQSLTVMAGNSILSWSKKFNELNIIPFNCRKVQFLKSYALFFCLRSDGTLNVVSPKTLLARKVYDDFVSDFVIIQDNDATHILVIKKLKTEPHSTILQLLSFPGFESKFEINLIRDVHLINLYNSTGESIMFLENIIGNDGIMKSIRVKALMESAPEFRLQRLLKRHKFDEAMNFARKFNLSTEIVYRTKASLFVHRSNPWNEHEIDFDAFLTDLQNIEDIQFIFDCCSNTLISDYTKSKKLLVYTKERILQEMKKNSEKNTLDLLQKINDTFRKFETFEVLQKMSLNRRYSIEEIEEWLRFSRSNLQDEFRSFMRHGELEKATLIWTRHQAEVTKDLTTGKIEEILTSLPEHIPEIEIWPWLYNFVPSLLTLLPDFTSCIIDWVWKQTRSLETLDRQNWPQVALEFVNRFVDVLNFNESQQIKDFALKQQSSNRHSVFHRVSSLIQTLNDLKELKEKYRLNISMALYTSDPSQVVYRSLTKIDIEEIPSFVTHFLEKYIAKSNLEIDQVLCTYIQMTLKNSKSRWIWDEAPWEKRLSVVVTYIRNIQKRLDETLEILKKAPVPWSPIMEALANSSYSLDPVFSESIRIESNFIPMKIILKKYGYENVGVNKRLISCIVKKNRPEMVQDLLDLTENDSQLRLKAVSLCAEKNINEGNFEQFQQIMCVLDDKLTVECYQGIINYTYGCFHIQSNEKLLKNRMEILGWIENKLKEIFSRLDPSSVSVKYSDIISNITELKSRYSLKKIFDISCNAEKYYLGKTDILSKFIQTAEKNAASQIKTNTPETSVINHYEKVRKLASTLRVSDTLAVCAFTKATKHFDVFEQFVTNTFHEDINPIDFNCIKETCLDAISFASTHPVVLERIRSLLLNILNQCSSGNIETILVMIKWIDLHVNSSINEPPNKEWKLYETYVDGIASLKLSAFPFLIDALHFFLFDGDIYQPNNQSCHCNEFQRLFQGMNYIKNFVNPVVFHICQDDNITVEKGIKSVTTTALSPSSSSASSSSLSQLDSSMLNLTEIARRMQTGHCDLMLMEIVSTLYFTYFKCFTLKHQLLNEIRAALMYCANTLLKKVVINRKLDIQVGLVCLFTLPHQQASNWLTENLSSFRFHSDYVRHRAISQLGYEYFYLTKDSNNITQFDHQRLLHYWARVLLKEFSIPYKEIFEDGAHNKRYIMREIMKSDKESVIELLESFSTDFGFDLNDCFLLYLQTQLTSWQPTFHYVKIFGKNAVKIDEHEVTELQRKCLKAVSKINDKPAMKRFLNKLLPEINFYYYEIFLIMMNLADDWNADVVEYLCFLQNYTRERIPSAIEYEMWVRLHPGDGKLPDIAQLRFPYVVKSDNDADTRWSLIAPELNLRTYEKWLEIAPILKIAQHVICTIAIKGSVEEVWNTKTRRASGTWLSQPKYTSFFNDIKKCIRQMNSPEPYKYETAALYYVVNYAPRGNDPSIDIQWLTKVFEHLSCADQVTAAQECYAYAQLWEKCTSCSKNQSDFGSIEKVKFKYFQLTSEHILHTYGLAEERYLRLIPSPSLLIKKLYDDESIPLRYRSVNDKIPDINAAADALASLFTINMARLRSELLRDWLRPETSESKINSSVTETFSAASYDRIDNPENTYSDDNLLRACYIHESKNIDIRQSANFLINIGFAGEGEVATVADEKEKEGEGEGEEAEEEVKEEKSDFRPGARLRALQVLQFLTTRETLEEFTKRDEGSIRKYMITLRYLNDLEAIGLMYSIESFENCSKLELVEVLTRTRLHSSSALILISDICLDFNIVDRTIWDLVLHRMATLHMVKGLTRVLLNIGHKFNVLNCDAFISGWQTIVSEPFRKLSRKASMEEINDCVAVLRSMHSCPIVDKLQLRETLVVCFESKHEHLAAAFLPFLNRGDHEYVLNMLAKINEIQRIFDNLSSLSFKGLSSTSYILAVIKTNLAEKQNSSV